MSSDSVTPAIQIRHLSKQYMLSHKQTETTLVKTITGSLRRGGRGSREVFRALDDITLDIGKGDVIGLIGRNGAGKSTLLKVLSRITAPTSGRVEIRGQVGSLLEVGTGFHPELTGRENVFLNGSLLGMSSSRVKARFDEIVDFSGTEQFLDTPVKRYSSGMYVRLAFAVAAHLDVDVLLVDEVLAVGDTEFQEKCLGKMQDVSRTGRTVVFVSHQMQSVLNLCSTAALLDKGKLAQVGPVTSVVTSYLETFASRETLHDPASRPGTGEMRVVEASLDRTGYAPGEEIVLTVRLAGQAALVGSFFISVGIWDSSGNNLVHCDSRMVGRWYDGAADEVRLVVRTPWLKPGRYHVNIDLARLGPLIDMCEGALSFEVQPLSPYSGTFSEDALQYGLVFADFDFTQT